jgi:hypothetical protein
MYTAFKLENHENNACTHKLTDVKYTHGAVATLVARFVILIKTKTSPLLF